MNRLLLLLAFAGCHGGDTPTTEDGGDGFTATTAGGTTTTSAPEVPPLPEVCDAGDAAWVELVMPFLWGRKPHGSAEVQMYAEMAQARGRAEVVRAMTHDDRYYARWRDYFNDMLNIARSGDKYFGDCFEKPMLPTHDGALTAFLSANNPREVAFDQTFDLADVMIDGLVADNVLPIYQATLLARMNKPTTGANVSEADLEYNRRVDFAEVFSATYVSRNQVCIACHNSEFSVTDDADPALDRTWALPGQHEIALFGQSTGVDDIEKLRSMFRYHDLVDGSWAPWGWKSACGTFARTLPADDFLDQNESYFIHGYDATGSVWEMERDLAAGGAKLAGVGLDVAADGTVDGQASFAYLVASTIADQAWAEAMGGPKLTIAYNFARNADQLARLQTLTDALVTSNYSFRELLVAITTDPYFNPGAPGTCTADPYGMAPVLDPYTVAEEDPAKVGNGPGDRVHRIPGRVLQSAVHEALGWPKPEGWYGGFFGPTDEEDLQAALGVFLRQSQPGFNGVDFQGLLAFEDGYGVCKYPFDFPKSYDQTTQTLLRVSDATVAANGTVGDAAMLLKDRLLGNGLIGAEERALVEALIGVGFDSPAADVPDLGLVLGPYCGALLMTPDFMLQLDPVKPGPIPPLALDRVADCEHLAALMANQSVDVTCDAAGTPTVNEPPASR